MEQTDRALETAIAFLQARQAGEVLYGRGGRSAGCVIKQPSLRERWLKVKWSAAGEMIPLLWDGELLAIGLEGVSKPRIFGFFDWEAIGIRYRATTMSVARGVISQRFYLHSTPPLAAGWWDQLVQALATIAAKQTDRIHVSEEGMERRLRNDLGLRLKGPFPAWQTAHADLNWANLTAPYLSILDWETWGRAPYGFDVALLHLFSIAQPDLLSKVKEVFSSVIARPEYDIAFLLIASDVLRKSDSHGNDTLIQKALGREVDRVLAEGRFADF